MNTPSFSMYSDRFVDPLPDPQHYADNPPSDEDEISLKLVKAAPTNQTYSVFYDPDYAKFERLVLKQGKGLIANSILKKTMAHIKHVQVKKYHEASEAEKSTIEVNPLKVFHEALNNVKPIVSVRNLKHGANTYRVPHMLNPDKQFFIASKWMLEFIRSGKPDTPASLRLGNEVLAAYNYQGHSVKKKVELHKIAEANRAYAHFRWGKR